MTKNWVFDLDGTLVDSFAHYFDALKEIFHAHGAAYSPELNHAALTDHLPAFFESHLGARAVTPALDLLQVRSNEDAARIRPFEGFASLLEQLAARGARVGVWTNRDLTSASLILKHSGLDRLTEFCISGSCVSRRKPDPEGLLRALQLFGCAPHEVTMVGDHEHDVGAAKQVGTRAVRASWHSYWQVPPCTVADAQFFRVADFADWAARGIRP